MEDAKNAPWITAAGCPAPELEALVRARVLSRIQAGEFAEENIRYIRDVDLSALKGALTITEERLELLRQLCQRWDVRLRPAEISSHRPLLGPIIVAVKKMIFPLLAVFLKDSLHQQRSFNATAVALLTELSEDVEKLKRGKG